jgi:hypothetical protein
MSRTTLGILIGLALGFAIAFGSFGDACIVALFAALGFGAAKIVDGDVDVAAYLSGRRNQ